nr:carboxylesterase patb [Quercus suber]
MLDLDESRLRQHRFHTGWGLVLHFPSAYSSVKNPIFVTIHSMRSSILLAHLSVLAQAVPTNTVSGSGLRYFNFTNIRYAAPPLGINRFRPPKPPIANDSVQTAGVYGIRCPQAYPAWENYVGTDVGTQTQVPTVTKQDLSPPAPGSSEDCLFLDILVPERAFASTANGSSAVLVFLHGGGYGEGSKTAYYPGVGSGLGLLENAAQNEHDLIYVAINYRLGLFGFLAGNNASEAAPNLGLQDQNFALQWVARYIHLFGGDSRQVTLMGESAGAGSIMYHLASSSKPLFHRAVLQSPYTLDIPRSKQEEVFNEVLRTANVTSVSDLKRLSTENLQTCNSLVLGPVADGKQYPSYPATVLGQGRWNHSIPLMVGHNSDEGFIFASPFVKNDDEFVAYVASLFPEISHQALGVITDTLYPNNLTGRYGYMDQQGRLARVAADYTIVCNSHLLDNAGKANATFAYEFAVPPGWHASDVPYTFWGSDTPDPSVNGTLASILQSYITNFVATGSPNSLAGGSGVSFPVFDTERDLVVQDIDNTLTGPIVDTAISIRRCKWWQKGKFM